MSNLRLDRLNLTTPHKDQCFAGAHPAIVDTATFEAAQSLLVSHTRKRTDRPTRSIFALTGRIFDATGAPMCPTSVVRAKGKLYRYYVSAPLLKGAAAPSDQIRRLPAEALEELLQAAVHPFLKVSEHPQNLRVVIKRVEVGGDVVRVCLHRAELDGANRAADRQLIVLQNRLLPGAEIELGAEPETFELTLEVRVQFRGGRTWLIRPRGADRDEHRRIDTGLRDGLRYAHAILRENGLSPHGAGDRFMGDMAPLTLPPSFIQL